ncbi:MAG: hypothetical protein ABIR76_16165 [Polaromonas sp.]
MKRVKFGLVSLGLGISLAAGAQPMFKCTDPDGTKLSFRAVCPEGQVATKLPPQTSKPTAPAEDSLNQMISNVKAEQARQQAQFDAVAEQAIGRREILVGMTEDQAVRAWGRPTSINATVSTGGRTEQWVYRTDAGTNFLYVYNGRVRSAQTSR